MNPRTIFSGAALALGLVISSSNHPGAALAQAGDSTKKQDDNYLSMEVNALRTIYLLRGTDPELAVGTQNQDDRLHVIKNQFASCAQKEEGKLAPADISDTHRKVLVDLLAALVAEQEERIEELDKKLQDLRKVEDYELDDRVEITDEVRQCAGPFVQRNCTADQVTAYLASYGKDLPNPRTLLFTAMRVKKGVNAKKPSPEEWKEIRAFTIREVTWQVGGLHVAKGDRIGALVGELLDKAYAMSDDELKNNKKAQALRIEAQQIANKVGPTDLLKHVIEQDVAEMLSNPRLVPAVEARLKHLAAKKKQ